MPEEVACPVPGPRPAKLMSVVHQGTRALPQLLRSIAATPQSTWNLWPGLKSHVDITIFLSERDIEAVALTLAMYLERQLNTVLEIWMVLENLGHIVAIVIASQLKSLERAAGGVQSI